MQIKGTFTTVELATLRVWTNIVSLDLSSSAAHVLLSLVCTFFPGQFSMRVHVVWAATVTALIVRAVAVSTGGNRRTIIRTIIIRWTTAVTWAVTFIVVVRWFSLVINVTLWVNWIRTLLLLLGAHWEGIIQLLEVHLLYFELLLLFGDLIQLDALHEFVRVCHDLWDEVMLVVILQIVYFLQVLVVLPCDTLDVWDQAFILQVQSPVLAVIIHPWGIFRGGLIVSVGIADLLEWCHVLWHYS